jgi:hypothetical protein
VVQVLAPEGQPFDHGRFECVLEPWPEDQLLAARRIAETGEGFLGG